MMATERRDFRITTEKLEELKENIPRAGPKYRLGMYFETIHNLHEFDDIRQPSEDGYTSYWETDTEVEEELGNFIFSNVTGDSASVICIDEAVDILTLREQQQRQKQILEREAQYEKVNIPQNLSQPDEHVLERSHGSKHSSGCNSRQSHHSGSDGIYHTPPPVPPPRRNSTAMTTSNDFQDHTYETLDDCQEQYQVALETIYISKASEDSRGSSDSAAKPVNDDCDSDRSSSGKGAHSASKSPQQMFSSSKPRSSSLPQSPDAVQYRHRRKISEPANPDHNRKRRSEKIMPKQHSFPAPIKGYQIPEECHVTASGIPPSVSQYSITMPPVSPDRQVGVTSPERREGRKGGSLRHSRPPSLFIKHKGKTFVIPVVGKKLQQKLEKVKGPPQVQRLNSIPKNHGILNTSTAVPPSTNGANNVVVGSQQQTVSNLVHTMRSHASPPKIECDHAAPSHKRKSSKSTPKQVTHYGML